MIILQISIKCYLNPCILYFQINESESKKNIDNSHDYDNLNPFKKKL